MGEEENGGWVGTVAVPAFESLHEQFKQGGLANVDTKEFTTACALLTGVFDRLGMALQLASQVYTVSINIFWILVRKS